jgi:uncharacterized membrane protein YhfC
MLINIITAICMLAIVAGPLFFVVWAARRSGWEARLIGVGAATFALSQVVHLPLNWALGNLGVLSSAPPIDNTSAVMLGITSGLCEELARYAAMRWWVREVRDGSLATGFGLGHGGIEAVLVGILGCFTAINMLALQTMDLQDLGLEPAQLEAVQAQVLAYQEQAFWQPLLAPLERALAMINHVWMSLLVMLSLLRRQARWLFAAIAWHALLNGLILVTVRDHGAVASEAVLVLITIGAVAGWWKLKNAGLQG